MRKKKKVGDVVGLGGCRAGERLRKLLYVYGVDHDVEAYMFFKQGSMVVSHAYIFCVETYQGKPVDNPMFVGVINGNIVSVDEAFLAIKNGSLSKRMNMGKALKKKLMVDAL